MTERSETHRKLDAFSQHLLDACRFVLVSPSLSANIGSAVRALTTMGIPDLMVAAPRDAAFREDAGALALAAGAEARLAQAVQIVAFSLRQAVLEREAGHARASGDATPTGAHSGEPPRTLAGQPTDVCGREDAASPAAGVRHDGSRGPRSSERLADLGAVEGLVRHAESSLAALGTLDPARPRRLMARLRHLFGRTSLTAAEVDLLRGICRDIDRRTKGAQSAATGSAMPSAKDMT